MHILLVEDDSRQAEFIIQGLVQDGASVDWAADGAEGFRLAQTLPYDLFIFDLMLPLKDGFTLIQEIRTLNITTPILVLSAMNSVDSRVKGLRSGGDDYLVKPFAFPELLARLDALRRRANTLEAPKIIEIADLKVDLAKRKVFRNHESIDLQPREYELLEYLVQNRGRVISKTMIIEQVWGYNFDPQTNIVEARISRLREKIDRSYQENLIHTVRGVGYIIESRNP